MPSIFGAIISNKLATLKELKEYYTYQEALDLQDIIFTDNYNSLVYRENMDKK